LIKELSEKLREISEQHLCPFRLRVEESNTFLEFRMIYTHKSKITFAGKFEIHMKGLTEIESAYDFKKYLDTVEQTIRKVKVLTKNNPPNPLPPFTTIVYLELQNRYIPL
jgi:reverse gyrase